MNFHFYSNLTIPIQKPESIVKIEVACVPDSLPAEYTAECAFWELTDEEVDTAYRRQVDDFGTEFGPRLLDDRVFYFAIQRADDPGMFKSTAS